MKEIINRIHIYFLEICVVAIYYLCKIIILSHDEGNWVVIERGTDARDNGYWFYKYIKEKHPEQKVNFAIEHL